MTSPTVPHIPIRKSPEVLKIYQEEGPKFGAILKYLYDVIKEGKIKNIETAFIDKSKKTFGSNITFPFQTQTNYLGERFDYSTCVSIDSEIAHGRSHNKRHKIGSIVSVDCGVGIPYKSYHIHLDAAFTVVVKEDNNWVSSPQKALKRIVTRNPKNTMDIARIIRDTAKEENMKQVVSLTGHGIGFSLHEAPVIHNAPIDICGVELLEGLCFCAEPIFVDPGCDNFNSFIASTYIGDDGWVVCTSDGLPSSHFETTYGVINGQVVDLIGVSKWDL